MLYGFSVAGGLLSALLVFHGTNSQVSTLLSASPGTGHGRQA